MNLSSPLQHIKDKISSDAFSPMPLCHDDIPYIGGLARQIVVEIGKRYDPSLFDNHRQILYMTYGPMTQRVFVDLKLCRFKFDTACCRKGNRPWRGLALVPGWTKIPIGKPCTAKGCSLRNNSNRSASLKPVFTRPNS